MVFEPHNLTTHADFVRFSDANGTDYEAYGDDSRLQLAYDVAESIATIGKLATDLLYDFMRHKGLSNCRLSKCSPHLKMMEALAGCDTASLQQTPAKILDTLTSTWFSQLRNTPHAGSCRTNLSSVSGSPDCDEPKKMHPSCRSGVF